MLWHLLNAIVSAAWFYRLLMNRFQPAIVLLFYVGYPRHQVKTQSKPLDLSTKSHYSLHVDIFTPWLHKKHGKE